MGTSAGVLGVVGALGGMFGGGFGSPGSIAPFSTPYSPYISPAAISSQAGNVGSNINTLAAAGFPGYLSTIYPWANQALTLGADNTMSNPYRIAAGDASQMGKNAAATAYNAGTNLYGPGFQTIQAGQSLVPFASEIETAAFDPQSKLYLQQVQNLRDQINVANSQSGISTSPYGASVEANALGNFNLNWQNNLLNRMTQGAGAASNLINTAAGATSTGAGVIGNAAQIAGTAPQSYLQAGSWPYLTNQQIAGDIFSNTGAYTNLLQGGQTFAEGPTVTDPLSLIGAENQTNAQAVQAYQAMLAQYDTNLAAQKQSFGENQLLGSALGRSLAGIGGSFSGGGTGGNVWSGLNFNNSPLWNMAYNSMVPTNFGRVAG